MSKNEKMAKIANTTVRTITNWKKDKPQLIEALNLYIEHIEEPEEITFDVWIDTEEGYDRLNILNTDNDTTIMFPYQDKYSYFENLIRTLGNKYGIVDFRAGDQDEPDTFKVKRILKACKKKI